MKLLSITFKDLLQSLRSTFALVFMFGVPILVTGMFYFMFGGNSQGKDAAFNLPQTRVLIVNQDEGSPGLRQAWANNPPEANNGLDLSQADSIGDVLVQVLQGAELGELLAVSPAADAASARAAVDSQQAGVAVIIPADFTRALIDPQGSAAIELYQDPTLSLGPGIVQTILARFIEQASAARVGLGVIRAQMSESGLALSGAQEQMIGMAYVASASRAVPSVERLPFGEPTASPLAGMLGLMMGGMMIFFAFFTGANSAQTILMEEEKGTLQRLFTTPTVVQTILGGKFLATLLTVLVQVSLLLLFAGLVFGIRWGQPLSVALVGLGTMLCAASFGIFLISLLKNLKQAGVVFGGVITLTGMLGMSTVFTGGAASANPVISSLALLVPQGWAMNGLRLALEGAAAGQIVPSLLGLLGWSVLFFTVGVLRFRRRYVS